MAKAPLAGQVKTRLLGELTAEDAADLYAAFLSDTFVLMEDVAAEREALRLVLCYTPEGAAEAFEKVEREGSLMLAQRGADLGERLQNCLADLFELGYEAVVIIGGDSPTLPGENVWEALESLTDNDQVVLGPAEDAGYYLLGMRQLHPRLLQDIPWSTSEVLAVTRERAREANITLIELPSWYDVDTPEELARLRQELKEQKDVGRYTRRCLKEIAKRAVERGAKIEA
ncbi:MAG: TIGR04282 family arsenosugar biosynthesis glycosyltransferase [Deltaproteobacteria bacterium]|nr:TIGR04282 family arsenosugar biosynthesis glycosyltransferase [Deltaproteobacteria bacterium]